MVYGVQPLIDPVPVLVEVAISRSWVQADGCHLRISEYTSSLHGLADGRRM